MLPGYYPSEEVTSGHFSDRSDIACLGVVSTMYTDARKHSTNFVFMLLHVHVHVHTFVHIGHSRSVLCTDSV